MVLIVDIYTDGSCLGNPGPGGWAYYIPQIDKQGSGSEPYTTNNRMELTAIWQALTEIERTKETIIRLEGVVDYNTTIIIHSDSLWAINCLRRTWRATKHLELFNQVWVTERELHIPVQYHWIHGHNGVPGNELVDKLAHRAALTMQARQHG